MKTAHVWKFYYPTAAKYTVNIINIIKMILRYLKIYDVEEQTKVKLQSWKNVMNNFIKQPGLLCLKINLYGGNNFWILWLHDHRAQ